MQHHAAVQTIELKTPMNTHRLLSLFPLGLITAAVLLKSTILGILGCLFLLALILFLQTKRQSPCLPPFPAPADPVELRRTILRTLNAGKSGSIPEENLDAAIQAVLQTWTPIREKHPLTCQISRHLRQPQITLILPGKKPTLSFSLNQRKPLGNPSSKPPLSGYPTSTATEKTA